MMNIFSRIAVSLHNVTIAITIASPRNNVFVKYYSSDREMSLPLETEVNYFN